MHGPSQPHLPNCQTWLDLVTVAWQGHCSLQQSIAAVGCRLCRRWPCRCPRRRAPQTGKAVPMQSQQAISNPPRGGVAWRAPFRFQRSTDRSRETCRECARDVQGINQGTRRQLHKWNTDPGHASIDLSSIYTT